MMLKATGHLLKISQGIHATLQYMRTRKGDKLYSLIRTRSWCTWNNKQNSYAQLNTHTEMFETLQYRGENFISFLLSCVLHLSQEDWKIFTLTQ